MDTRRWQVCTEVGEVLRRNSASADHTGRLPGENLEQLRSRGLLGFLVPDEHGGWGATLADLVQTAALFGGACASSGMAWVMHCQQVDAIARHATPALREQVLPQVAAGAIYIGSVTTEMATGSHLLRAHEALDSDGGALRVERAAPIVSGGRQADSFLVTMRTSADATASDVSLVYVDRAAAEVEVLANWDTIGMRGTESVALRLLADVSPSALVGGEGGFRSVAVESFAPLAHIGWAAVWLGAARSAYREVVASLRHGPGQRRLSSEVFRYRLARARVSLELVAAYLGAVVTEVTVARSANRTLAGPVAQTHLNVVKVAAAEHLFAAVSSLVEIAGLGEGYAEGDDRVLPRVFRDLRSASLNYSDDRLHLSNGSLAALDTEITLCGVRLS
jgi:acyl-CoA dehydrogenase